MATITTVVSLDFNALVAAVHGLTCEDSGRVTLPGARSGTVEALLGFDFGRPGQAHYNAAGASVQHWIRRAINDRDVLISWSEDAARGFARTMRSARKSGMERAEAAKAAAKRRLSVVQPSMLASEMRREQEVVSGFLPMPEAVALELVETMAWLSSSVTPNIAATLSDVMVDARAEEHLGDLDACWQWEYTGNRKHVDLEDRRALATLTLTADAVAERQGHRPAMVMVTADKALIAAIDGGSLPIRVNNTRQRYATA